MNLTITVNADDPNFMNRIRSALDGKFLAKDLIKVEPFAQGVPVGDLVIVHSSQAKKRGPLRPTYFKSTVINPPKLVFTYTDSFPFRPSSIDEYRELQQQLGFDYAMNIESFESQLALFIRFFYGPMFALLKEARCPLHDMCGSKRMKIAVISNHMPDNNNPVVLSLVCWDCLSARVSSNFEILELLSLD